MSTILNNVLSGIHGNVSGLYDHIAENDYIISGLLPYVMSFRNYLDGQDGSELPDITPVDPSQGSGSSQPSQEQAVNSLQTFTVIESGNLYTLSDNTFYKTTVAYENTTFRLPNVESNGIVHEIIIVCKFNSAYATIFTDASNNILQVDDINEWDSGDVVQYYCRYEEYLSRWVIMPILFGNTNSN